MYIGEYMYVSTPFYHREDIFTLVFFALNSLVRREGVCFRDLRQVDHRWWTSLRGQFKSLLFYLGCMAQNSAQFINLINFIIHQTNTYQSCLSRPKEGFPHDLFIIPGVGWGT